MDESYYNTAVDIFKQGARVFVPGIGLIEGAIEMVQTGSPTGAAKFFVPGIGIVEGALEGTYDAWKLSGGSVAIRNVGMSTTTLLLLAALAGLLVVVVVKD